MGDVWIDVDNEWTDGWTDIWVSESMGGLMYGRMNRWMIGSGGCVEGRIDG